MPLVRLKAGQRDSGTDQQTTSLSAFLVKEAGMDGSDAAAAIRRLGKGKSVDVTFDLGENKAAEDFMKQAAVYGLTAKVYQDEPLSWAGSRPSPLFLKLSLAVLAGFAIWLWVFRYWFDTTIFKAVSVAEGVIMLCWGYSVTGGILDRRPESQARKDWGSKLLHGYASGALILVTLVGIISEEPMIALVLLLLVLGGVGSALAIRAMNRP